MEINRYLNKEFNGKRIVSFLLKHYHRLAYSANECKSNITYEIALQDKSDKLKVKVFSDNKKTLLSDNSRYLYDEIDRNCIRKYEIKIKSVNRNSFFEKTSTLFSNKNIISKIKSSGSGVQDWVLTLKDENGKEYTCSGKYVDHPRSYCKELVNLSIELRALTRGDYNFPAFDVSCYGCVPQTVFEIKERFHRTLTSDNIYIEVFKRGINIDDMLNELTARYIIMIHQIISNNVDAHDLTTYGQKNYFCGKIIKDHSAHYAEQYIPDQQTESSDILPRIINVAENFNNRKLMNMYTPFELRNDYTELQPFVSRLFSDAEYLLLQALYNIPDNIYNPSKGSHKAPTFFAVTQNRSKRYTVNETKLLIEKYNKLYREAKQCHVKLDECYGAPGSIDQIRDHVNCTIALHMFESITRFDFIIHTAAHKVSESVARSTRKTTLRQKVIKENILERGRAFLSSCYSNRKTLTYAYIYQRELNDFIPFIYDSAKSIKEITSSYQFRRLIMEHIYCKTCLDLTSERSLPDLAPNMMLRVDDVYLFFKNQYPFIEEHEEFGSNLEDIVGSVRETIKQLILIKEESDFKHADKNKSLSLAIDHEFRHGKFPYKLAAMACYDKYKDDIPDKLSKRIKKDIDHLFGDGSTTPTPESVSILRIKATVIHTLVSERRNNKEELTEQYVKTLETIYDTKLSKLNTLADALSYDFLLTIKECIEL